MKRLTSFTWAGVIAIAAVIAALVISMHSMSDQISNQNGQVARLHGLLTREQAEITYLSNQVTTLNMPSDPLSAYNDICNQQMTNSNSGITQTYYFPCTNSAQTIPQPGN